MEEIFLNTYNFILSNYANDKNIINYLEKLKEKIDLFNLPTYYSNLINIKINEYKL